MTIKTEHTRTHLYTDHQMYPLYLSKYSEKFVVKYEQISSVLDVKEPNTGTTENSITNVGSACPLLEGNPDFMTGPQVTDV